MATAPGEPAADLIARLLAEPHRFSFFEAVRLLTRAVPGAVPPGRAGSPSLEAVRLRPALSFAFPNADVVSVEETQDGERRRFVVESTFLGLYGTVSPLPAFVSEDLLTEQDDESLVRGFLDIFHHRVLSLFYRAWEKYRHYEQFQPGGADAFSGVLFALGGFAAARPRADATVPALVLLRYIAQLTRKPCSAAALGAVLGDYFGGVPVRVQPCAARWVAIAPEDRNRLGVSCARLGADLQLGSRVPDRAGRFRIEMGPLRLADYEAQLPGRTGARATAELVRMLVVDGLEHERRIRLADEDVPDLALGGDLARLGWTSWLGRPRDGAGNSFVPPREDSCSNSN
jgi:type VI secretion system protein ImpH